MYRPKQTQMASFKVVVIGLGRNQVNTVQCELLSPNGPKPVEKSRKHVLRAYCPHIGLESIQRPTIMYLVKQIKDTIIDILLRVQGVTQVPNTKNTIRKFVFVLT